MIYTASFFQKDNHHGQVISISRSTPKGITVDSSLLFLAPPPDLLRDWNAKKEIGNPMPWAEYTDRYRAYFCSVLSQFKEWLATVTPTQDITLCCWERAGEHCHRNLVGTAIEKFAPGLWGGADVPMVEALPLLLPPETVEIDPVQDKIAPGIAVIVDAIDWFTDEPFTFRGVVKSQQGDGYMIEGDDHRARFGYFQRSRVKVAL